VYKNSWELDFIWLSFGIFLTTLFCCSQQARNFQAGAGNLRINMQNFRNLGIPLTISWFSSTLHPWCSPLLYPLLHFSHNFVLLLTASMELPSWCAEPPHKYAELPQPRDPLDNFLILFYFASMMFTSPPSSLRFVTCWFECSSCREEKRFGLILGYTPSVPKTIACLHLPGWTKFKKGTDDKLSYIHSFSTFLFLHSHTESPVHTLIGVISFIGYVGVPRCETS
jgi:hypothetical protein